MANLKEVRERITSVKSTQQITKAMKMVSAAKLRRAQQAIQQMRPYANKLNEMLGNILSSLGSDANTSFGTERNIESVLMVVVTSNRGLCGAFNTNVIKAAIASIENNYTAQREAGKLRIVCIGKKGFDFFRKNYADCSIVDDYVTLFDNLTFDEASIVSNKIMDAFEEGRYDKVEVAYGSFKNPVVQDTKSVGFLPVEKLEAEGEVKTNADYVFEPGKQALLENLVPDILRTTFYSYLLDTHASEHGARMTAMDSATENANDLLRDLKISYNKARQEAITNEISEIVGGAAALEGGS